jgi:hypothetical protein
MSRYRELVTDPACRVEQERKEAEKLKRLVRRVMARKLNGDHQAIQPSRFSHPFGWCTGPHSDVRILITSIKVSQPKG